MPLIRVVVCLLPEVAGLKKALVANYKLWVSMVEGDQERT